MQRLNPLFSYCRPLRVLLIANFKLNLLARTLSSMDVTITGLTINHDKIPHS